jgi:hypothetical protein
MIMKIGINNDSTLDVRADATNGLCDMSREREIVSLRTHRNML